MVIQKRQMEFVLKGAEHTKTPYHTRRSGRARWWFHQMHKQVDQAQDWSVSDTVLPSSFAARFDPGI